MKMGYKLISIALLWITGIESVFAGPFLRGHEGGEALRAARQQRAAQQQFQVYGRRATPAVPALGVPVAPAAPGEFSEAGPNANTINRPQEQVRRMGGRMTIEERRALRRQINEAGHDIYAPKR
jgi:hypothetical protein